MAREANASYEGQGQRTPVDIKNSLKRVEELERKLDIKTVSIAAGTNNRIAFGWDAVKKQIAVHIDGTWLGNITPTKESFTNSNLAYQVGETVKASIYTAGFITSAGTEVFFSVPIHKPIATDKATISIAGVSIRQNNKYLLQNTLGDAKIAVHSITPNNVMIKITFPKAPDGVINNDAVGVELSGAYLTVIS